MDWQQNVAQLKEDWTRDGYLVLKGFLDQRETKDVASNIERYIGEVLPTLSGEGTMYEDKSRPETIKRLSDMAGNDEYFRRLYHDDRFFKLAEELLEDGVIAKNMQWFNKNPGDGKETPPHQDGYYFMLKPNEALTMWLALDRADEENGCMRYVPGAHLRGMRPHQTSDVLGFSKGIVDYVEGDYAAEKPIVVEPGDVAIHHSMMVHRADANKSSRPRSALGFVYFARRAEVDEHRKQGSQKEIHQRWEKEGKI